MPRFVYSLWSMDAEKGLLSERQIEYILLAYLEFEFLQHLQYGFDDRLRERLHRCVSPTFSSSPLHLLICFLKGGGGSNPQSSSPDIAIRLKHLEESIRVFHFKVAGGCGIWDVYPWKQNCGGYFFCSTDYATARRDEQVAIVREAVKACGIISWASYSQQMKFVGIVLV